MPSRAESRVLLERALRGILIVTLAVLLWQSLREQTDSAGRSVSARGAALSGSLSEWSTSPRVPGSIQIQLDNVPPRIERAWLGALAAAGSRLSWSGDVPATMIDAQPVASPTAGTTVTVAAPNGVSVVVGDEVGVIDTVRSRRDGVSFSLSSVSDQITGSVGHSVASTVLSDSVLLHKVLVIGSAGWESKFVVAALEEAGWKVDALIRVAPNVYVRQGSVVVIDTARYSAVVALDGTSLPYASRIIGFAQTGGGVVLAPQASRLDALAILRSGTVGNRLVDSDLAPAGAPVDLGVVPLNPITSLRSEAIPVGRRATAVAIAARRVGAGRALQVGYADTWRWRMSRADGALSDHRLWWTDLVSSVAYAPRVPQRVTAPSTDQAPTIGLVAAIGTATRHGQGRGFTESASNWMLWLPLLLALGLIAEVASRRLRGTS